MAATPDANAVVGRVQALAGAGAFLIAGAATAALPYAWWRYGGSLTGAGAAVVLLGLAAWIVRRLCAATITVQVGVILSAGVLARVAMSWLIWPSAPDNDPLSYRTLAEAVVHGEGLIAWGLRAHYPQLYPLLLAGMSWLTGSARLAPVVLNLATDIAGAALLFHIASRMVARREALQAAAILFLWPSFVAASPVAQKESLTILLTLAAMAVALRLAEGERGWRWAALFGVVSAMLALTQPALVTFPAILLLVVRQRSALPWPRFAAIAAIAIAFLLLTMLPWWLRNWQLLGGFVPLTSAGGLAFAGLVDEHVLMVGQRVSEIDAARASTAQALGWIAAHPLRYLGSVALQFGRAMALDIAGIQQYHWFVPPPPQAIASTIMTACQLCWIALWIVVGKALRTSGTSRDLNFAFLGAVALQLLLVNGWLQFHERHRYLATPLLILIAVRGWRQNDLRAAPPSPARSSRTLV